MPEDRSTSAERGLLELSIALSKREITAGNEFALYVLVKNPFNRPIFVHRVNVSLPSELKLTQKEEIAHEIQEQKDREAKTGEQLKAEAAAINVSLVKMRDEMDRLQLLVDSAKSDTNLDDKYFSDLNNSIFLFKSEIRRSDERLKNLRHGSSDIRIESGNINTLRVVSFNSDIRIGNSSEDEQTPNFSSIEVYDPIALQQELAQKRSIDLESSLPRGCALQPSCTDVYRATLNVERSLVFTPATYRLQFNVNFSFDQISPQITGPDPHQQIMINTISHELAIRPSIRSVMVGAVIGGLFGSIARMLQSFSDRNTVVSMPDLATSISTLGGLLLAIIRALSQ